MGGYIVGAFCVLFGAVVVLLGLFAFVAPFVGVGGWLALRAEEREERKNRNPEEGTR